MAQARLRGAPSATGSGLRVLSFALGLFLIARGLDTIGWIADSSGLLQQCQQGVPGAASALRWYLEAVCIPGAPIFARVIPLGAFVAGIAMIVGFWTRMAAVTAFLVQLNVYVVLGTLWSRNFVGDGDGLPLLGGLLALAIGGAQLPLSLDRRG